MVRNPRFHRWRDTQGLMNPREIVVHEMKGNRCFMVRNLLGKRVSQSGKPSHRHAHCQVLPLREAGGNVRDYILHECRF